MFVTPLSIPLLTVSGVRGHRGMALVVGTWGTACDQAVMWYCYYAALSYQRIPVSAVAPSGW